MGEPINNVRLLSGESYIPEPTIFDPLPSEEENYTIRQGLSLKLGETNIRAVLFADHADTSSNLFAMNMPIAKETIGLDLDGSNPHFSFGPSVSLLHYAVPDENGRGHIETAPAIGFFISVDLNKNPVCALTGLLCD